MLYVNNLAVNGTEEQRARWLPGACDGSKVCAMGMSEAGAGTDVLGMQTKAVARRAALSVFWVMVSSVSALLFSPRRTRASGESPCRRETEKIRKRGSSAQADGDGFVINGGKTWITNGCVDDSTLGDGVRSAARPSTRESLIFVVEAPSLSHCAPSPQILVYARAQPARALAMYFVEQSLTRVRRRSSVSRRARSACPSVLLFLSNRHVCETWTRRDRRGAR